MEETALMLLMVPAKVEKVKGALLVNLRKVQEPYMQVAEAVQAQLKMPLAELVAVVTVRKSKQAL